VTPAAVLGVELFILTLCILLSLVSANVALGQSQSGLILPKEPDGASAHRAAA
jgi:hypothetical protein